MRIVELNDSTRGELLNKLLQRSPESYGKYEDIVNDIIKNIRERKDEALFEYTKKFDHFDLSDDSIRVSKRK